ncbi:ribosome biogenesis GTPase [Desulfohalotomaculum tongense]|uniref:ribosome small subunit-dependent GTPase A n=1 Tax=Desulforadius tongensis TaxID=1216062 RepID=UPI00195DDE6A|nr:ribosome small subunit-dependent GTPase A [Desulforadius tongensis]MBM7855750.1 ribosome biogenesis GTPase [Desulforadius tongensis]
MVEGIVIKAYSGYYYVQDRETQWVCRLRGKFRLTKERVLVGDRVKVKPAEKNTGVIYEVLQRRNELVRPPIANVDQAVITFAACRPDPNLDLLDRFLVMAEGAGIKPVICLNKADLLEEGQPAWLEAYRQIGYTVLVTSAKDNTGIDQLKQALDNKISVFAGPSGVGKSSLLNAVHPGLKLKTGEISRKLGRGKHTTRHVELIPLQSGGLVADTPGFSSLYLPEFPAEELVYYFPELAEYAGSCRFNSCMHNKEPDCAVKEAVRLGKIDSRRYNSYLQFLSEIWEKERRY